MKREFLSIIIVILLIGFAFIPSINGDVCKKSLNDDFIDLEVEFFGIGRKQSVRLTQQKYDEFNLFFNNFQKQLSESKTQEEAINIFNDAIEDLNDYGLLCGLTEEQVKKMITKQYQTLSKNKFLKNIANKKIFEENENFICLVAGQSNNTQFFSIPTILILFLNNISNGAIGSMFTMFYYFFMIFAALSLKYKLFSTITFGRYYEYTNDFYYEKAYGNMWTAGLLGTKEWNHSFIGNFSIPIPLGVPGVNNFFVGVKNFIGIQVTREDLTSLLGLASRAKIIEF